MLIILLFQSQQKLIKVKKKNYFDINKFKKFEHKIKFIIADYQEEIDFINHTGEVL